MSADRLIAIITPPEDENNVAIWLEQRRLGQWLEVERTADRITLYGSGYHGITIFVHTVLVPSKALKRNEVDGFTSWSGNPFDAPSCGLVYGGGQPPRVELSSSRSLGGHDLFKHATQTIYGRSFEARHGNHTYYELAQEIALAHGLHWMEEREAWCRLDDEGNVGEVVKIERIGPEDGRGHAISITMDREVLELHMAATKTCLVQMFDSACAFGHFSGWGAGDVTYFNNPVIGLRMKYRVESTASYFRGAQVIPPRLNAQDLGAKLYAADHSPKAYASFITQDWKNRRLAEVSCSPDALASYFDKDSKLPFQTSPVFFKPEVLDKYKADPDKYHLEDRSVSCRNSWSLQTFDVNDAGQVHTLITYLGNLPYSEQLYWKSFNEAPKAPISKRSLKTDFHGEFYNDEDGLRTLKATLERLRETRVPWFVLHEPKLVEQLHYPLTASTKTWGDTLTTLAKCVTEGLKKGYFESEARRHGAAEQPNWGSIRWAKELLTVLQVDPDRIAEAVDSLVELQRLRSKLGAHAGGAEAAEIRKQLLKAHKTPRAHIQALSSQLAMSLDSLESILKA